MKTLIRTMIVLAVLGFAVAAVTPATGMYEGTSDESGNQVSPPVVAAPSSSKEPVPSVPPPSVGIASPAADDFAVFEEVAVEPPVFPSTGRKMMSSFVRGKSSNMLVIPDTEIKAEDVAAITQDMQVMSHIFDKIFQGPRMIGDVFMDFGDFFGRGSRTTQAIYIQGYGTLFLLEVDFPFSPPPESTTKQEQPEETDSVWQQAKQEIFSPTQFTKIQPSEDKYDEEKVRELKSRLIRALKHAANVRNLKPDELIILTVIGKGRSYGLGRYGGGGGGYGGGYGGGGAVSVGSSDSGGGGSRYITTRIIPGGTGVSSHTVLTIRAKKSDVDAFAKGDLDYDKFREKVQILTYPSLGQQVGRGYGLFHYSQTPEPSIQSVVPNSTNRKDNRF